MYLLREWHYRSVEWQLYYTSNGGSLLNAWYLLDSFGWNLDKALTFPHVCRQKLHDLTDSVKDENVPWNCNQSTLASPKHQKQIKMHRQKGKDVKYTGITVEARVKKIISQCSKTNVSHVVGVFLKRILWEFVTRAYSDILHWYKVFGDKVYLWKENSSFQLLI